MPRPPILRSDADSVTSGSSFFSGSYGTPRSMNVIVTVTGFEFESGQKYWIPEDLFEQRTKEDNVPYDIWHQQGYIDLSPGNKIDYRLLVQWFQQVQQEDDIFLYKLGYDRWSATYFVQDMEEKFGKPIMDPVAQGVQTLSAPMKALKADLAAKKVNMMKVYLVLFLVQKIKT